jgi:hypothetical protein
MYGDMYSQYLLPFCQDWKIKNVMQHIYTMLLPKITIIWGKILPEFVPFGYKKRNKLVAIGTN